MQGEVYLLLKDYKLASLHVKIASKLTTGFNQAKTQKALVEAFLGNHQQVFKLQKVVFYNYDLLFLGNHSSSNPSQGPGDLLLAGEGSAEG